jgi:undecaprenyl-diphosphatase
MKSYWTEASEMYPDKRSLERLANFISHCDHGEIVLVRKAVQALSSPVARKFCQSVNSLMAGWLYAGLAIIIVVTAGSDGRRLILVAGLAAAIGHIIYPIIKSRIHRLRPCEFDASLNLSMKALDRYSCPSGHIMTATLVAIPLGTMWPLFMPVILLVWGVAAWARISSGHHYPSDILVGALLGISVSLPVTSWLL